MLSHHGRCAYSAIVDRPVYDWPNGARLAVYIAINIEHFPFGEGEGGQLIPGELEDGSSSSQLLSSREVGIRRHVRRGVRTGLPRPRRNRCSRRRE